jgi:aryl-alcohol dehydrogenase-like predicted oxidoreductase
MTSDFSHVDLPHIHKRVLRLGVAGNYGLNTADVQHAVERGVGLWVWSPRFKSVTPVLREVLPRHREQHVIAVFGMGYTARMVRKGVENALRTLGVDQIDIFLLGWLGRGSRYSPKIRDMLVHLRDEGKIRAAGTSIHDRRRAGRLALDSVLDAFMLRYNAKHPGAEQDVFPHLVTRDPVVISYTATSWRQLLRPIKGIEMPPWPGRGSSGETLPPLTPVLCYRFCLSNPHVHVTLTGPKNRQQLDENLAALEAGPLNAEEESWVRTYGREVKARRRLPYL